MTRATLTPPALEAPMSNTLEQLMDEHDAWKRATVERHYQRNAAIAALRVARDTMTALVESALSSGAVRGW